MQPQIAARQPPPRLDWSSRSAASAFSRHRTYANHQRRNYTGLKTRKSKTTLKTRSCTRANVQMESARRRTRDERWLLQPSPRIQAQWDTKPRNLNGLSFTPKAKANNDRVALRNTLNCFVIICATVAWALPHTKTIYIVQTPSTAATMPVPTKSVRLPDENDRMQVQLNLRHTPATNKAEKMKQTFRVQTAYLFSLPH